MSGGFIEKTKRELLKPEKYLGRVMSLEKKDVEDFNNPGSTNKKFIWGWRFKSPDGSVFDQTRYTNPSYNPGGKGASDKLIDGMFPNLSKEEKYKLGPADFVGTQWVIKAQHAQFKGNTYDELVIIEPYKGKLDLATVSPSTSVAVEEDEDDEADPFADE